jgi:hypothetical protein
MKALASVLFCACLASTAIGEPAVPRSELRAVVPDELKELFKGPAEPGPSSASDLPIAADQPVVSMKPFIVTAHSGIRDLPVIFQQQEQTFMRRRLWLQNGRVVDLGVGKVFKAELELNFRLHGSGADLFRISISW